VKTTNRSQEAVKAWKAHKAKVMNSNLVGVVPIGNRPKPEYEVKLAKGR